MSTRAACLPQRCTLQSLDRFVGNNLVQASGKAGDIQQARQVFECMHSKNSFSWNMLAAAYAKNGHLCESRYVLKRMPQHDAVSWTPLLVASAQRGDLRQARGVFDTVPHRDVVSWNTIVAAYARSGHLYEANALFIRMPQRSVVSWTPMIVAFGDQGRLWEAKEMFDQVPWKDVITWNAMVAVYAQNGYLQEALSTFHDLQSRSLVSWNGILSGYAMAGRFEEANAVLQRIPAVNVVSWNTMLSGLARKGQVEQAKEIFENMPEKDAVSFQEMVDALTSINDVTGAETLFSSLCQPGIGVWNAMLLGYADNGLAKKSVRLFLAMELEGLPPDRVTWISILDVCSRFGLLKLGRDLHAEAIARMLLQDDVISSCFITMFGKCGKLDEARDVFGLSRLQGSKGPSTWSSMVLAYAEDGQYFESLDLFRQMPLEGIRPDSLTFLHVLSCCSHAGLVEEGRRYLQSMVDDWWTHPSVDHFSVMVDLLARSGRVISATDLTRSMPFEPTDATWRSLLGGCTIQGSSIRGQKVAKQLEEMDPCCSSSYILLANALAASEATLTEDA